MLEGKADVGGAGHGGSNMGSSMSNGGGSRGQHRQLPSLSASASSSGLRGGADGGDGLASNGHGWATGAAAAAGTIGHEELEEVEVELPDPLASGTRAPPSQHYHPPLRATATATAGVASPDSPPRPPPPRARRSSSHSQHHGGQHHQHRPLEILYHISPSSALACLPVFLLFEARAMWASPFLATPFLASEVLLMLTLGGAFSFLLILAEVKLVKISSSLTMSMFGAVKEVITVALSMLAFHDAVSPLNVAGLVLAIGGAVWYRSYKLRSAAEGGRSGSADGGWAPAEYLPAASGIFHLDEDEESEGEEEEEDGRGPGRRRGRGGADGYREQELRAVGRGRDVGLA